MTLAGEIEELAGEPIDEACLVFITHGCDSPPDEVTDPQPWEVIRPTLALIAGQDYNDDPDYPAVPLPRFIAWSEHWVIVTDEYDCMWGLRRIPRHPVSRP